LASHHRLPHLNRIPNVRSSRSVIRIMIFEGWGETVDTAQLYYLWRGGTSRAAREREGKSPVQGGSMPLSVRPARSTDAAEKTARRAVPPRPPAALSWKGVTLGALLLWPNALWVQQMEIVRGTAHPTTVSLYFNAIFILLVVTLINHGLASFRPKWALSRADLLVVYSMLAIGSSVAGHDALEILVPMLAWPWRFADASNRWEAHWFRHLPSWAMVSDKEAMAGYFLGNSTIYTWAHLRAWLVPLLLWVA